MNLPVFIARRYLFAKKTHNVINIISYISVVGIALGAFALVVVLSVTNGFNTFIKSMYTAFDSDMRITVAEGKIFDPTIEAFQKIKSLEGIASYSEVLEDNVLLEYQPFQRINDADIIPNPRQSIATMKGVDDSYLQTSDVAGLVPIGEFKLKDGSIQQTVVGYLIAEELGVSLGFVTPIKVWVPERGKKVSTTNAIESMRNDYIYASGLLTADKTIDSKYIFTSIDFARGLLSYTTEVSAIELRLEKNANGNKVQQQLQEMLGPSFIVKNRLQQNETLYRVMSSEKFAIYLILIFMAVIISFNIVGSLTMLMVDKKKDVATLQSMGADTGLIKRIFLFEGWFISIASAAIGAILGVIACLAQQYFKPIPMPSGFLIDAYPVKIQILDVFIVLATVIAMGYLIARIPVSYLAKRLKV
ncbi:MAG: FtsX-like permease family protein [Prevotellaceae bacterium]|jgi:lipoprotein-releasing system permease protein|nr:FtsX-like permease family protein [Prevotellaceae bacterium]